MIYRFDSATRLTDELERQLILQAMEEQFRPHPLRALGNLVRKSTQGLKALFSKVYTATHPAI